MSDTYAWTYRLRLDGASSVGIVQRLGGLGERQLRTVHANHLAGGGSVISIDGKYLENEPGLNDTAADAGLVRLDHALDNAVRLPVTVLAVSKAVVRSSAGCNVRHALVATGNACLKLIGLLAAGADIVGEAVEGLVALVLTVLNTLRLRGQQALERLGDLVLEGNLGGLCERGQQDRQDCNLTDHFESFGRPVDFQYEPSVSSKSE
jgi:hypothetical protein